MMGIIGKKLLLVFVLLALGGAVIGGVWYFQRQGRSATQTDNARSLTYSFPPQTILTYNNAVEKKSGVTPHYALSGTVMIGSGDSHVGLRPIGESGLTYYPLDVVPVARGSIYRFYQGAIQRVSQVALLGQEDEIYLTYYADYGAGRAYGIVQSTEQSLLLVLAGIFGLVPDTLDFKRAGNFSSRLRTTKPAGSGL